MKINFTTETYEALINRANKTNPLPLWYRNS